VLLDLRRVAEYTRRDGWLAEAAQYQSPPDGGYRIALTALLGFRRKTMLRLLLLTGAAVSGIAMLLGQGALRNESGSVPVQMVVTAEARHGNEVPVLRQDDVTAYERQDHLKVEECVPANGALDLFLLVDDASGTSLGSQLSDLRKFVEAQPPTTEIGIGYMRNGTFNTVQNLTADHAGGSARLRLPMGGGVMASPWLSLSDLVGKWPGKSERREVVMVTSGIDPLGGMGPINPYLDNTIEDCQRAKVIVYTIYTPAEGHSGHSFFRLNWAQNHLAQLSEETGGESYMLGFGTPVTFAPYLNEIAGHLAHQYRVRFLIKPDKKASFRSVRFSTEVPNTDLVAATKVYVPAAQ
jgi:hypothetical protein